MDYRRWGSDKSYGYRWMAESTFSSIKRTLRKWDNMVQEIEWKAYLHNRFMEMLPPLNL
ncbi:MAG: hypothetical protein QXQ70_06260 [Candidatus Caldarchaeum sp.]